LGDHTGTASLLGFISNDPGTKHVGTPFGALMSGPARAMTLIVCSAFPGSNYG
jgi:hypothetical protein